MGYKSIDEVKRQMEHYCAYQERSHKQVEEKLKNLGMYPEAIDHIIIHLLDENFLNEERFAKSYARGKFYHKDWGKQKIIQGLKQHQIHDKLISKALSEIDDDDYKQTILKLIDKKRRLLPQSNTYLAKQKIARYLNQKGYRYDEFSSFLFDQ